MNTRTPSAIPHSLVVALVGATTLVACFTMLMRAQHHRAAHEANRQRYVATRDRIEELLHLRSRTPDVSTHQRPANDVLAQINEALAVAGVPSAALREFKQESDVPIRTASSIDLSNGEARRQSLAVVLDGVTLTELGSFLATWNSTAGDTWAVARLEVTPARGEAASRVVERTPLRARIVISATYVLDQKTDKPAQG